MNWVDYVQGVAGVYMLLIVMMMSTENLRSLLFFRVLPTILGLLLTFAAIARWRGWPV